MRKSCKRKIWALVDPIQHAKEGACITGTKELIQLRGIELSALEAICTGKGTVSHWQQLVGMLNICETMARGGIGPEALEHCALAEREMLAAAKRYEQSKRMVLTEVGINALREVYAYHDLQRTSISRGEYDRWIKKTADRLRSKAPGVIDVAEAI